MIFALIIGCAVDVNGVTQEGPNTCLGFASRAFETEQECIQSATTDGALFVLERGFMPVTFRCVTIGSQT